MTREYVAQLIHWQWFIWFLTILNPFFMFPQLIKILRTRDTKPISISMLYLLLLIQWGFSLHGFFIYDTPLLLTNALAGGTTLLTIACTLWLRHIE